MTYEYTAGTPLRVIIDARDTHGNLRASSTTDAFVVTLTGRGAPGTIVTRTASPMQNGTFTADLLLTVAEPYDLSITIGGAAIAGSPLLSKILVVPALTQAAYSVLTSSVAALTAGVSYTYRIQAKDIFSNIVLNPKDRVGLALKGPTGGSSKETQASMVYLSQLHRATFSLNQAGSYTAIIQVT